MLLAMAFLFLELNPQKFRAHPCSGGRLTLAREQDIIQATLSGEHRPGREFYMKSRERVLQSMSFTQPDRVPVDFGAHRSSGIMAIAYKRLREYLGLPQRPLRVYDIPQQLAVLDEDILELFHIDTIEMGRGFCQNDSEWEPWVLPDGTECFIPTWVKPKRNERGDWIVADCRRTVLWRNSSGRRRCTPQDSLRQLSLIHISEPTRPY